MKVLVVVDMQNDFIDGSLANDAAKAIVPKIKNFIKEFDGPVIFTLDTHREDYLQTYEGKHLPIEHCIEDTEGWKINYELAEAGVAKKNGYALVYKPTFSGASEIAPYIQRFTNTSELKELHFVGTCTDICVVSNVLGLKEYFPETDFIVHADMCAGLTVEKHNAALEVMRSCQCIVMEG